MLVAVEALPPIDSAEAVPVRPVPAPVKEPAVIAPDIVTADGKPIVTEPFEAEAVIWFVVPEILVTPVLLIVPAEIDMPVPAV